VKRPVLNKKTKRPYRALSYIYLS